MSAAPKSSTPAVNYKPPTSYAKRPKRYPRTPHRSNYATCKLYWSWAPTRTQPWCFHCPLTYSSHFSIAHEPRDQKDAIRLRHSYRVTGD